MNVACEHCGAEYSLDEENVSSRGVRITCPSCSHVFTVYLESPDELEEELEIEIEEELEIEIEEELEIEVLSAQAERKEDSVSLKKTQEKDQAEAKEESQEEEVEANLEEELHDMPSETEEAIKVMNPEELVFSKVGLKNWKVKTALGLVYDFSGYKTLNKYLRDGKVKSSDLLSYDGKNWTPIKDIEDLGEYFCTIYLKFLREQTGDKLKDKKEKKKGSGKTMLPMDGMNDLAAVMAEAQAEVDGTRTTPRLKGKASKSSSRKGTRPRTKSKKSAAPDSQKISNLVFLGGLLVMAGIVWFFSGSSTTDVEANTQNVIEDKGLSDEAIAKEKSEADALRSEIQEKIKQSAEKAKEENPQEVEPSNEEPQLRVKIPDEILAKMTADQKNAAKETNKNTRQDQDTDFPEQGRKAIEMSQWPMAISAYQKAYRQNPLPVYKEMWGYALFQSENLAVAKPILQQAVNEGSISANKWLGFLYRKNGDIAGSNKYFTVYLSSNPSDAKQIQLEMRR